ncbi:hypothetical protein SKAU_G00141740, partial [Synaphobranchus kaupii]
GQIGSRAQAGEDRGDEVYLVHAVVLVVLQVAVRVLLRLVDHDPDGREVERSGRQVVNHVAEQPALPAHDRDEVLLVQQGEEEEGEREQPEEHGHEQDKVDGALVLVGGDGDPQAGSQHHLQHSQDPEGAPQELQEVLPRLRLRGHLPNVVDPALLSRPLSRQGWGSGRVAGALKSASSEDGSRRCVLRCQLESESEICHVYVRASRKWSKAALNWAQYFLQDE